MGGAGGGGNVREGGDRGSGFGERHTLHALKVSVGGGRRLGEHAGGVEHIET